MKTSESVLEMLEQNARWWKKAADHCESVAPHLHDPAKKQEFMLMSAVYQERADIHAQMVERLRREEIAGTDRLGSDLGKGPTGGQNVL
jgi:hypothetical protein